MDVLLLKLMLLQEREDKAFCSSKSVVQAKALVSIATFDIVTHPFYTEKKRRVGI